MRSALDTDPTIQARLSAWAWERLEEWSTTGKVTLEDGTVINMLDPSKEGQNLARTTLTHLRATAFLTASKNPRRRIPEMPDDFRLPETR